MKNVLIALCLIFSAVVASAGEVSVLKKEEATVAAPAVVAVSAPCCQSQCEELRSLSLPPWQVRRLNRVADRQEARDAKRCGCCDACKDNNVLVKSNKKSCSCCR